MRDTWDEKHTHDTCAKFLHVANTNSKFSSASCFALISSSGRIEIREISRDAMGEEAEDQFNWGSGAGNGGVDTESGWTEPAAPVKGGANQGEKESSSIDGLEGYGGQWSGTPTVASCEESFQKLLGELPAKTFEDEYWEKAPIMIHHNDPDIFDGIMTVAEVGKAAEYADPSNVLFFKNRRMTHEYQNLYQVQSHPSRASRPSDLLF